MVDVQVVEEGDVLLPVLQGELVGVELLEVALSVEKEAHYKLEHQEVHALILVDAAGPSLVQVQLVPHLVLIAQSARARWGAPPRGRHVGHQAVGAPQPLRHVAREGHLVQCLPVLCGAAVLPQLKLQLSVGVVHAPLQERQPPSRDAAGLLLRRAPRAARVLPPGPAPPPFLALLAHPPLELRQAALRPLLRALIPRGAYEKFQLGAASRCLGEGNTPTCPLRKPVPRAGKLPSARRHV
mmetsp:Transcript_27504/g.88226  ORF Transcript_27504/g.88226 Transcript_27504/m.88226 type:complete len:240 (-) Transcript_27504:551-1270(-)